MRKRIHVNQHIIKANRKSDNPQAPLTCKTYKENVKGFRVKIRGDSEVIYSPDKPLDCGATVWVETESPVEVDGRVIE